MAVLTWLVCRCRRGWRAAAGHAGLLLPVTQQAAAPAAAGSRADGNGACCQAAAAAGNVWYGRIECVRRRPQQQHRRHATRLAGQRRPHVLCRQLDGQHQRGCVRPARWGVQLRYASSPSLLERRACVFGRAVQQLTLPSGTPCRHADWRWKLWPRVQRPLEWAGRRHQDHACPSRGAARQRDSMPAPCMHAESASGTAASEAAGLADDDAHCHTTCVAPPLLLANCSAPLRCAARRCRACCRRLRS